MVKLPVVAILLVVVLVAVVALAMMPRNSPATSTSTSTYYTTTALTTATTTTPQGTSGNVSFTSYSCTSGTDSYGDPVYNLQVSGTATGPEMTTLSVAENPLSGSYSITCGSWVRAAPFTSDGRSNNCYRAVGNQSSTAWSFSVYNMTKSFVDQQSQSMVYVDARENIFNGSDYTHVADGSITVHCT